MPANAGIQKPPGRSCIVTPARLRSRRPSTRPAFPRLPTSP